MARTKGASRRVVSWTSVPAPVQRPGFSRSYDHTLVLDCGHTVVRRFPQHAQFKFSDCPVEGCGKTMRYDELQDAALVKGKPGQSIVEWQGRSFIYFTIEDDAARLIEDGVTIRADWTEEGWKDHIPACTDSERLRWLQEKLLTANNGIFWFHVTNALGFDDDEFTAPGDVTMGELFNAAIDKRIREGK